MAVYFDQGDITLHLGDCLDVLREMPEASVDAVVTDPPYGLEFMGADWDTFGSSRAAAGMSRTGYTDGSMRLERPSHFGGLNPKCRRCERWQRGANPCSCDTPDFPNERRARTAAFGEWCEAWARECLRVMKPGAHLIAFGGSRTWHRLAAGVEDAGFKIRDSIAWLYASGFPKSLNLAGDWEGWGTALKPTFEPIVVGRKPLAGTVAANVARHGTGALNIDACRVPGRYDPAGRKPYDIRGGSLVGAPASRVTDDVQECAPGGRWPPNVVMDDAVAAALDQQTGTLNSGTMRAGSERQPRSGGTIYGADSRNFVPADTYGDSGGASRFFPVFRYAAKAPTSERPQLPDGTAHPTVKPLNLMRWVVRLITAPGGVVLDPFNGSGTTAEACMVEGFRYVGIDRKEKYLRLTVESRLAKPIQPDIFGGVA